VSNAIELKDITKRFPGVIANDRVNLTVAEGEIHAICGENGAGKSTLMKILYGMQAADEGEMYVNDQAVAFHSPNDAIDAGIGMVHQHFMLADQLSVLENVILGSEPTTWGGRIDFKEARRHMTEVGAAYGLDVDPDTLIEDLEPGNASKSSRCYIEVPEFSFSMSPLLYLCPKKSRSCSATSVVSRRAAPPSYSSTTSSKKCSRSLIA